MTRTGHRGSPGLLLLVLVVLQFSGTGNAELRGVEAAQRQPLALPVGPRAPPVSPIAAPSLEKWTWDRIPTSFHGAPRTRFFNDSELERLAKYQIVALEKWYGPCGAKGGYGVPQSGPSCAEGQKSEVVFAKLKETNPNLTAVLYWNTMFNFAFYEVNQRMLDLEARGQRAFLRDERGEVVMLCNDGNAYCNVTTFDWTSPAVRALWIDSVINASHHGVDGLYADHSAQEHIQIGSHAKGQHGIQLCNGGRKAGPWGPSTQKGHTCWNFNQSFADEFNSWHAWGTEFIQDVLPPSPGPVVPAVCGHLQVNTGIGPPDLGNATVVSSAAQCCETCRAMAGCDAWAWHTEQQNMCHFHPADAKPSPHKRGAFSGYLLVH